MIKQYLWLLSFLALVSNANAQTPIADVLKEIDPASGKPKRADQEYTITGIVAARITLPDNRSVAFVLKAGEPALQVIADPDAGKELLPRTEVKLSGILSEGPLGAGLKLKAGSITIAATNQAFGASEVRGGAFFKDPSSLAGRYVQLTNVTFAAGPLPGTGTATVKTSDGNEVTLLIGKHAFNQAAPDEAVNVFGIPLQVRGQWHLVAARFLLARAKSVQAIAFKRTCLTCHNPDTKLLGPAYREVAARYKTDPNAVTALMRQMEMGGVGKWGPVPMPALAAMVPMEDRKALAEWIMSYRWDALLAD